jgi:hypothetical protein
MPQMQNAARFYNALCDTTAALERRVGANELPPRIMRARNPSAPALPRGAMHVGAAYFALAQQRCALLMTLGETPADVIANAAIAPSNGAEAAAAAAATNTLPATPAVARVS